MGRYVIQRYPRAALLTLSLDKMPDTTAKIQAILDDALRESFPEATDDSRTRAIRRRQKLYGVGGGATLPHLAKSRGRGSGGASNSGPGATFPSTCTFGEQGTVLSYASRPSDHAETYEHDAWSCPGAVWPGRGIWVRQFGPDEGLE